ncbi:hypothetical protein A2U01_0092835, partial [Trifolium medium]|nr:hypothetical protein [Trifolium medium]
MIGEWRAVNGVQQQNSAAGSNSAQRHGSASADFFSGAVQHVSEQVCSGRNRATDGGNAMSMQAYH